MNGTGEVGFIHNVIYEKYSLNHLKEENIDFICVVRPAMIQKLVRRCLAS